MSFLNIPLDIPKYKDILFYFDNNNSRFIGLPKKYQELLSFIKNNKIKQKTLEDEQTTEEIAKKFSTTQKKVSNQIKKLKSLGFFTTKTQKNKNTPPKTPETISIYAELTEACNFRCPGCATSVDRRQAASVTMSLEEIKNQLTQIAKSLQKRKIKNLKIKYAGGEPLLPMVLQRIVDIQPFIDNIKTKYDLKIDQVILTNGVFLEQAIPKLKKMKNIRMSVSLWALGKKNDEARGKPNNTPTFDKIINGMKLLTESNIRFSIHHVLTPYNAKNFAEFLTAVWDVEHPTFIGKKFLKNPIPLSINLFRPQIDIQSKQLIAKGYKDMVTGIKQGFRVINNLLDRNIPLQPLNSFDYLNFSKVKTKTCGSGYNYISFGPNKSIVPCHQLLSTAEKNTDSSKDPITTANEKFKKIHKSNSKTHFDNKPKDISPKIWEVLSLHGGKGCPLVNKMENREVGHVSSMVYEKIVPYLLSLFLKQQLSKTP